MSDPTTPSTRSAGRIVATIVRLLFGLAFVVFGLNGFFNFIPPPPEPPPAGAAAFGGAMMATGYMMQFVKGTEVFCGVLLLANRFVPLALVVLMPIILNIVAFHVFLAPSGTPMAIVFLAIELYLAWVHRAAYRPLLTPRYPAA